MAFIPKPMARCVFPLFFSSRLFCSYFITFIKKVACVSSFVSAFSNTVSRNAAVYPNRRFLSSSCNLFFLLILHHLPLRQGIPEYPAFGCLFVKLIHSTDESV